MTRRPGKPHVTAQDGLTRASRIRETRRPKRRWHRSSAVTRTFVVLLGLAVGMLATCSTTFAHGARGGWPRVPTGQGHGGWWHGPGRWPRSPMPLRTVSLPMGAGPNTVNIEPYTGRAWVSNLFNNTVTVLDSRTDAPIATIPAGEGPAEVAFDGGMAYVADSFGGTVTVIDARSLKVVRTIYTGHTYTQSVAIDHLAQKLYVASYQSAVLVYSLRTGALLNTLPGDDVNFLTADQRTHRVYVSNYNDALLQVIDTATDTVVQTIAVGHPAEPDDCYETNTCIVNPSGPDGIGVNERLNRIYVDNVVDGTTVVLDARTGSIVRTIPAQPGEFWPAVDESADVVYSSNYAEGTVTVLDGWTGSVKKVLSVGEPFMPVGCFSEQESCTGFGSGVSALAFDPANGRLYVPELATDQVQVFSTGPGWRSWGAR